MAKKVIMISIESKLKFHIYSFRLKVLFLDKNNAKTTARI